MSDYLELLRADLADQALIELGRRPAVHPAAFQIQIASLGILVAVCTSLANRLANEAVAGGSAIALFDIFRPVRTARQIAGDAGMFREQPELENVARLADERIEFAVRVTGAWVHSERSAYSELVPTVVLADAWRNACEALTTIFAALNPDGSRTGPGASSANCETILRLLVEAMEGGWPCCDEAGGLSIPGWAERRAVRRVNTKLNAAVVIDGKSYPAEIVNASRFGLGVTSAASVRVGEVIEIAVNERILGATVKWAENGNMGIRLDEQLDPRDELLQRVLP